MDGDPTNDGRVLRTATFDSSQLSRAARRPLSAIFATKKHSHSSMFTEREKTPPLRHRISEEVVLGKNEAETDKEGEVKDSWLKGDKFNGFDVLQQNFKLGINASKEFAEFLKERSNIEETYSKSLNKLAVKCATANSHVGIFEPCWKYLQSSTERLANVHSQVITHLSDITKDVKEYNDQQKEKQKQLKDEFASTSEAVSNLQNLSASLLKAKELYQQRSHEVEKLRKDITNLKDLKNAETKYKKCTEDYKQLVDKRETARREFHDKMTEMSQKLQTIEESHLKYMLELLSKYGESIKAERILLDQIIDEFGRSMVAFTVDNLLQQFINLKQTGKDVPVPVNFEEIKIESAPVDCDAMAQQIKEEKRAKRKEEKRAKREKKAKNKEKVTANGTIDKTGDEEGSAVVAQPLELDAEGYVIRKSSDSIGKSSKDEDESDSDFETDSDDEGPKITVRIKPVEETKKGSNPDMTDEQLKKLTEGLQLMSPASMQQKIQKTEKKFTWGSQGNLHKLAAKSRSNNDLLNLDKNSDTASLHSLPMLDINGSSSENHLNTSATATGDAGSGNNLDASHTSSPLSSPVADMKEFPGSNNLSPADSMDRSADVLSSTNSDETPPPLPAKSTRPASVVSQDSLVSTQNQSSEGKTDDNNDIGKVLGISMSDINMFSNKLFVEDPVENSKSLPASARSTTPTSNSGNSSSLLNAPLKPPPNEKRSNSVVLRPPTNANSTKTLPATGSSVPRPKPGQLVAPPPSGSSRRGLNAPSSNVNTVTTTANNISSLSDLLDINFSTDAPTLMPVNAGEKENTTSHWVNLDLMSDIPNDSLAQSTALSSASDTTSTLASAFSPITTSTLTTSSLPEKLTSTTEANTTVSSAEITTSPPSLKAVSTPPTLLTSPSQQSATLTPTVASFEANITPPALPKRNTPNTISTPVMTASISPAERAIPIAVAFIETVNGVFKGADEKSSLLRVTGDMTISFPANIISILSNSASPPVLSFLVNGTHSVEQIFPNKTLVEREGQLPGGEGMTFKFKMSALAAHLKKQSEQGAKASYYNIDILKYQVRCSGVASAPLQLSAYWRCDKEQTDLKIDYRYNPTCMSSPVALNNVSVVVPVDGGVSLMQSKPIAVWSSEHQRCIWKLPSINGQQDTDQTNALRARFEITNGPSTPVPTAVHFTGEGSTISMLNFDLTSTAYKLSLVKKRFATGKYTVEKM